MLSCHLITLSNPFPVQVLRPTEVYVLHLLLPSPSAITDLTAWQSQGMPAQGTSDLAALPSFPAEQRAESHCAAATSLHPGNTMVPL